MSSFLTRSRYYQSIILGIFCVLCGCTVHSTRISITRTDDSLDVFTQEGSSCKDSWCSSKQSHIHKSSLRSCACRCNNNTSTFVYKANLTSLTCVDNVAIRSSVGHCKLLLGSNRADSPLSVLNLTSSGSEVLTGLNVLSWRRVMREEYLDNGTWFTGAVGNYTTFTTDNNLLKWSSAPDSRYAGRLVRVHFQSTLDRSCVIFKVEGTLSYNMSTKYIPVIPSSISLQPSPTTSYFKSTQAMTSTLGVNQSTTIHHLTSSKTKDFVPLDPATISPTLATVAIVTTSVFAIDIGGTKTVIVTCARGAWVFCQWVYLGAAIAGTLTLVFVGIVITYCACKRQRRRISASGHQKKPVFFKSELTEETGSSTELALIEVGNHVNVVHDHKEQYIEEGFYQNVPRREKPDNNQLYRPLRSSDGQDSPTSPASPQRFSSASSANDDTLYDDVMSDSKQLIKPQYGSQPPTPANQSKNLSSSLATLSKAAVLDSEEEPMYEIMETKSIPPTGKAKWADEHGERNYKDVDISGIENQVFEEDDKRQSHNEMTSMEEQPNYEVMEENYTEKQPHYETMGTSPHLQRVGNISGYKPPIEPQQTHMNYTDFDEEEQTNYEIMDHSEKPSQQTIPLYQKMGSCDKKRVPDYDNRKEKDQEMEKEREYDIPVISENNDEPDYDIPEISMEFKEEQDYQSDDDDTYTYANVPETQANALREQLQFRKTWHSGESKLGSQTAIEKPGMEKRPMSWDNTTANKDKATLEEDNEELYTLPDDLPKPLPACLLKGRSSPQTKHPQTKDLKQNQASPKLKQRGDQSNGVQQGIDQSKPKITNVKQTRAATPGRTYPGSPMLPGKSPAKRHQSAGSAKKETSTFDHPEGSREGKASPKKGTTDSLNKLHKSENSIPLQRSPRSKEKPARRKNQQKHENKPSVLPQKEPENNESTSWNKDQKQGNKITGQERITEENQSGSLTNEQPLYTNLVEMQNDGPSSGKQNSDSIEDVHVPTDKTLNDMDDQQPLYENISSRYR